MGCGNVDVFSRFCTLHKIAASDEACFECVATYQDFDRKTVIDRADDASDYVLRGATDPSEWGRPLQEAVEGPDAHLVASKSDRKRLANAATQATLGNISKAKKALNQLEAEGRFSLSYDEVNQLINKQETTFSNLEKVFHECECEFGRQNSTMKKKLGKGLGISYDELRNMLSAANQAVKKTGWAIGSELSRKVHHLIVSVEPACELTDMCFAWGQFNIEPILAKKRPQKLDPEIAFIHALCAIASSDGNFCQKEQLLVSKIINQYLPTKRKKKDAVKAIRLWAKAARSTGLVETVAQSIVDVDNVKATPLQSQIHKCLLNVVNADGRKDKSEVQAYNAFIARLY